MLDVTAFSNALLSGTVSWPRSLGTDVITDSTGHARVYVGDDAAVYPLGRGDRPTYALRVPISAGAARSWPERYADLQSESGGIHRFLPTELTILDSEEPGEPELALLYRWIPGDSLTDALRKGASGQRLDAIVHRLADLAEDLQKSGLVHGDIAPGNIILRPDNMIALIDLDHMGSAQRGGLTPRRRPGYRLSDTNASAEAEDAFGLLVIMASVAAYSGMGELPADSELDRGSHPPLLFSTWDLMDPRRSELVQRLEAELTGVPALLLEYLTGACTSPWHRAPHFLADAVREVGRAPRKARAQSNAAPATGSWTVFDNGANDETWRTPDRQDHGSWPSSAFEERSRPHEPVAPTLRETEDVLATIAEVASLERSTETGRSKGRPHLRAEYRREQVARDLRNALATNDRAVLVRLAMSGDIAELGDSDRADLLTVLRALSYDQIARAIDGDQDSSIIAAIDPEIFPSDADIDEAFRRRVQLAREREAWMTHVITAVQQEDPDRCVELLTDAPEGGPDRLPSGIGQRARRLADIGALAADVKRGVAQQDLNAVVGPMSRLSAVTGRWAAYVDADEVVSAIGYARIRQRVIDRLGAGSLTGEDQWLVDCVIAAGELDDISGAAGKSRDEMRFLLGPRGKRHVETTPQQGSRSVD